MPRITGTLTQGGADAFVEASIATALEGQTERAFQVNSFSFEALGLKMFVGAVDNEWELAITRRTKAAMPDITDVDVMKKWKFGSDIATAVGQIEQPDMTQTFIPPETILIVEDPIYAQLDTNGTALASTVVVVVEYEIVAISAIDRLTLLTQSLT